MCIFLMFCTGEIGTASYGTLTAKKPSKLMVVLMNWLALNPLWHVLLKCIMLFGKKHETWCQ